VLEFVTLSAFSRYPNETEKRMLGELPRGDGRRQAVEDLVWALLTSKEFLFQH
jgi:hypothetical protein